MRSESLLHFIHTEEFDDSWNEVPLSDGDLKKLQDALSQNPEAGDIVRGTGGVRKYRIPARGKGTRGGARVIYYYVVRRSTIYLLLAYGKGEADDLSADGRKHMRTLTQALDDETDG